MTNLYPSYNNLSELEKSNIVPDKYKHLMTRLPNYLIGYDTNTKIIKGKKKGYLSGIIHLTPYKKVGDLLKIKFNLCAMAEEFGCHKPCLNDSGRGKFHSNQIARMRKTILLHDHPNIYDSILEKDILRGVRKAERENKQIAIRLNGTSDINVLKRFRSFLDSNPNIMFYDYTKVPKHLKLLEKLHNQVANYHLTYSYSKVDTAQKYIKQATNTKFNIAMVIKNIEQVNRLIKNNNKMKLHGRIYNLINGDDDDLRFLDPDNSIVLLRYKETRASQEDIDNFVVDIDDLPNHVELI